MNIQDKIDKLLSIDVTAESPVRLNCTRKDLAALFSQLGFTEGAEIGVDNGFYSEVLCQQNPNLKLHCIDPWKVYSKYEDIREERIFTKRFEHTKKLLEPYNCNIIRKSSTGALKDFAPRSLDFVYIDGNHTFDYVTEDLRGWSKIVKVGGIIAGHDYKGRRKGATPLGRMELGVGKAVDMYVEENKIEKLYLTCKNNDSSFFFVNRGD